MDNAKVHTCKDTYRIIKKMFAEGRTVQFQCPFSPELNPIEYVFGFLKRRLKRNPQKPSNLIEGVKRCVKTVTKRDCMRTIDHVFNNLPFEKPE